MTPETTALAFRSADEEDLYAVEAFFLFSYRNSWDSGLICRRRWLEVMRPEARRLFRQPGVEVLIAFNPEMPRSSEADIYGWLAVQRERGTVMVPPRRARHPLPSDPTIPGRTTVLYVYVKDHYRGHGFARALFERAGIDPWRDAFDYVARTRMMYVDNQGRRPIMERLSRRARYYPPAGRKDDDAPEEDSRRNDPERSGSDRSGPAEPAGPPRKRP